MEFLMVMEWHSIVMGACNDSSCCCFCFDNEERLYHHSLWFKIYRVIHLKRYIQNFEVRLATWIFQAQSDYFSISVKKSRECMENAWSLLFSQERVILIILVLNKTFWTSQESISECSIFGSPPSESILR